MPTALRLLCLAFIVFLTTLPPCRAAAAESVRGQDLSVAAELDALTVAVNRLATLLEKEQLREEELITFSKLSKAIDYLNFRSRRIEALERDLATARATRQNQEDLYNIWEERVRNCDDLSEEEKKLNPDKAKFCIQAENQGKMLKARLSRQDEEIIGMENRLYDRQNELSAIESFVNKNLGEFH